MGIRRGKQTVYLNTFVDFLSKADKLGPVHFFAVILVKSSSGSCHLGRAGRNDDNNLVRLMLNFMFIDREI